MKKILLIILCILMSVSLTYGTVTKTTNLELSKPASEDTTVDWFDTMNDNMDLIDAAFDDVLEFDDGERIEDRAGAMWTGNTEEFITLTYQDVDNTIDATVPVKDEDNMASDSATFLCTQQSIKAYADTLHALQYLKTEIDSKSEVEDIWSVTLPDLTGTPVQYDYGRFTDADTFEGRSYAEVKQDLDLEIGTDIQAYDGALASISGLTYVSPSFIKLTANDTYAVRTIAEVITDLALDSDDLSDVASIAMLNEAEEVTGYWDFVVGLDIIREESAANWGPYLFFKRTKGAPTYDVSSGDMVGDITFYAWHSYAYEACAEIFAFVDGDPGDGDMPGRLEFRTTPDDSWTPVLRLEIDSAGNNKMGDGVWTNYVNISNAGVMTMEGTASINEPLSILAATTSAELAGVISDETGTGKLVFGTAPTLSNVRTDIWLSQDTNTFFGVDVVGAGNLEHNEVSEGYYNSAMGYQALYSNTTGYYNSAMGYYALRFNTTGYNNSAMGYQALRSNTTGHSNSAMGNYALYSNTTGHSNSAMGYYALRFNTTGRSNSAMGNHAGRYQADGVTVLIPNNSLYLGCGTKGKDNNDNNSIVIGYDAIGIGANTVVLGNDDITKTILKGNVMIGLNADTPTARLHLAAGTAAASTAPLKFTSGTLLTTPEIGAMEYDGTNLYFTRTGTTREIVGMIVTKTTTGDPTGAEGLFCINTFDNTFKIYAEGAWRELSTWAE